MQTHALTTPFGRRPVSLALLQGQIETAATRVDRPVDKWKIFRDLSEAREKLGLQDRSLAVLHALLSFYPHAELCATKGLVVFPSNAQLSLRAHGIAGTTLRRHLAALVDAGLVHRRDSPNGKRYARRKSGGEIDHAFGFSLLPLLTRSAEIAELAQSVVEERRAMSKAREAVSLCRRDVRKLLATAIEAGIDVDVVEIEMRLGQLLVALPRRGAIEPVTKVLDGLQQLRDEIVKLLKNHLERPEMDTGERQHGCHIQNPNTESIIESEAPTQTTEIRVSRHPELRQPGSIIRQDLSLSTVLKACPDIADYGPDGMIRNRGDLLKAAIVVRSMLGVPASVYDEACAAMGPDNAATVMACILMHAGRINAPGAYLRQLTRQALQRGFSPVPMVVALLRRKPAAVTPADSLQHAAAVPEAIAGPLPTTARYYRW